MAIMKRALISREMFPTDHRETWRDYLWYCLLLGTIGSGIVGGVLHGIDARHTFFLYAAAIGLCIMGALLVGWFLYVLLRMVMHNLTGGVS
jgi:hypothetical protein